MQQGSYPGPYSGLLFCAKRRPRRMLTAQTLPCNFYPAPHLRG